MGEYSLVFCFLEEFVRNRHLFFKCSVEFTSETIGPGCFSLWVVVLITNSISSLIRDLFRLSSPSRVSFGALCLSRNLFISSKLSNLFVYSCSEYSFRIYFCIVGSDIPFLITDFSNLNLLLFILG